MLLILLEIIMIKKFLIEDSLLKWVDNKNNSFKNGLELDLYLKHLKLHILKDHIKIENNHIIKTEKYNHKQNKKNKKLLNKNQLKINKLQLLNNKHNKQKLNKRNKENIFQKLIIKKNHTIKITIENHILKIKITKINKKLNKKIKHLKYNKIKNKSILKNKMLLKNKIKNNKKLFNQKKLNLNQKNKMMDGLLLAKKLQLKENDQFKC